MVQRAQEEEQSALEDREEVQTVSVARQFSVFDYSAMPRTDLSQLPPSLDQYRSVLEQMTEEELHLLRWRMAWKAIARQKQLPPREFDEFVKTIWGIRSGRGFGKTLAAANWLGIQGAATPMLLAAVAPTHDDVRHTCFEGPTGLYAVIPKCLIVDSNSGLPSLTLWNGTFIRGFAGDTPERLRGPQHHKAWCDEIASWKYPQDAWDNLWFGLRLGEHPQVLWTGTPKPTPFMRRLNQDPNNVTTVGSTYENRENLTKTFFDNIAKYEGTKIGRQELWGEILDPEEEGIVRRSQWRLWPAKRKLPKFSLIVMSLDTAFTEKTHDKKRQENDPTACSVWGMFDWKDRGQKHPERHVMLLDCWEEWLGLPDLVKRVKKEMKLSYGDQDEPILRPVGVRVQNRPRHQGRQVDMILIEDKGSGISLRQMLAKENVMTTPYNPGNADKLARLHIVSPLWPHGRVWVVESDVKAGEPRSWAEPLISQVCSYFGEGSIEHDDLMDTTTQALRVVMDTHMRAFTVKYDPLEEARRQAREEQETRRKRNPYDH